MITIINYDDNLRNVTIDIDGSNIVLPYPEDILLFNEWTDILDYVMGFENLAQHDETPVQDQESTETLIIQGDWI